MALKFMTVKAKINSGAVLEAREFRCLKTHFVGFLNQNDNSNIAFDVKIKNILKTFIKRIKLDNKVIEHKKDREEKLKVVFKIARALVGSYEQFALTKFVGINNMHLFQFYLYLDINQYNINMEVLLEFPFVVQLDYIYERFYDLFRTRTKYYEYFNIPKKHKVELKQIIYSVQIFDKMIKLITKSVLLNSKFFFLNNIKYNYTLLKLCDKTMKLVNSILLFCLLCDINIPYYCFHSDLSIAGNCRMCLVQLDTSLKPIASCAVSIGINSTIYTNTKIIQKAREGVLEFLLINHPLDCPICDQGGECDLQEQFITYGNDRGRSLKLMI
jgi:hypothetical protein